MSNHSTQARITRWMRLLAFAFITCASFVGIRILWVLRQEASTKMTLEDVFMFALSAYIAVLFAFSVFTDRAKKN